MLDININKIINLLTIIVYISVFYFVPFGVLFYTGDKFNIDFINVKNPIGRKEFVIRAINIITFKYGILFIIMAMIYYNNILMTDIAFIYSCIECLIDVIFIIIVLKRYICLKYNKLMIIIAFSILITGKMIFNDIYYLIVYIIVIFIGLLPDRITLKK